MYILFENGTQIIEKQFNMEVRTWQFLMLTIHPFLARLFYPAAVLTQNA